ncbi:MAG TPA: lipopolysaccharide heptosyltransferase II [Blastocatellia bacterium]|nr:lipopolysaccharide heptosyltransferase II [Blastocatellia bacterium]
MKRVMVRVPNWVGDAVMAAPALGELRRVLGEAHVTFVARPWVAGLFDGEGLADSVIPVEDARGAASKATQFIGVARLLRRERFDLAVLFQNAFGAALLARAAGARFIAGYPTDARRWLLDLAVEFEPDYKARHQVFYYLNIVARLEQQLSGKSLVDFENASPRLRATEEQKDRARELLGAACERFVVINPGATNSRAKQWLAERFAETADRLAGGEGLRPVIVGTAGDIQTANEVASRMKTQALVLAGRTSIAELKGVLALASLVISNDTGAAHVSAALGVPTVVVFGPTEHASTRPLSDVAAVVRHQVECSPCMLRDCPIDHRCMTRVEVDQVYHAARELFGVR